MRHEGCATPSAFQAQISPNLFSNFPLLQSLNKDSMVLLRWSSSKLAFSPLAVITYSNPYESTST